MWAISTHLEVVGRGSETQFQMGTASTLWSLNFIIVIFIHYKPRIAVAILDL